MQTIAVLITCFNRREKTLQCLQDIYNQVDIDQYNIDIYMVDGGSSDGTQAAVQDQYPEVNIETIEGLYWAGGMRAAWAKATQQKDYDFYWLLNDDTHLFPDCLKELLKAHEYALTHYGKGGIYIGSTQHPETKQFSYGGRKLEQWGKDKCHRLIPDNRSYQECDLGNANIMLVSKAVYQKIGGFCKIYTHGIADYDYTLRTTRIGFPVLTLPKYTGICNDDHQGSWDWKLPLKKRIEFLYSPKGFAYKEYLYYIHEFFPKSYYTEAAKLWLRTLFPSFWNKMKTL